MFWNWITIISLRVLSLMKLKMNYLDLDFQVHADDGSLPLTF